MAGEGEQKLLPPVLVLAGATSASSVEKFWGKMGRGHWTAAERLPAFCRGRREQQRPGGGLLTAAVLRVEVLVDGVEGEVLLAAMLPGPQNVPNTLVQEGVLALA